MRGRLLSKFPWSIGTYEDTLGISNNKIYVLYNTQLSKIISYGVMCYCLDEADLAKIATLPEERGRGAGGALLDLMLEDARKQGAFKTFLEVRESNTAARMLYASRDFKEIGKRKKYYRNPIEDAVVMVREEDVSTF